MKSRAYRYCGNISLTIVFDDYSEGYDVRIRTPNGSCRIQVGVPRIYTYAVDSPFAYDNVARAALAFAADEGNEIDDYADFDDHGYAIRRKK